MSQLEYSTLGFESILVNLDGAVLIVKMNRAKQRNSWGGTLAEEFAKVFELADKDDRVRVVILTADPTAPAYCSGADLSQGPKFGGTLNDAVREPGLYFLYKDHRDNGGKVSLAIYHCRKITIAAVNGHAAGVGMTAMQLPFDIRFVWAGAKLTFPFVRRGIVPEATSSYLLPRLLGHSRASYLFVTGTTISPTSPIIQPLYHSTFSTREEVFPAALALAKDLAVNTSARSIAYTKALLQHPGESIEENHLLDSRGISLLGKSGDAREGVQSFKERRDPKFMDKLDGQGDGWHAWFPWWKTVNVKSKL
ncbi:hypothetical protein D9758_004221 [Tetrapyrgos nigripes]|uniref:Peroxisomal enoyl-CoA-hydratase n=1 Tax=Tetrapyrgos nigripes TaxID=182062 RepID=A0A8H5LVB2_9AGAR|nr:hypothetical protein D9758_004221 [Tetrapyrgos nigripes]